MELSEIIVNLKAMREDYLKRGCSLDQFDDACAAIINEERED